jgi:large subunit ribosomal protein L16
MLMPKRTKWRRQQRGRIRGEATRGNTVAFGEYGLQAIEPGWVSARVTEGKVWIRVFPHKSITKKPAETRQGSGKGDVDFWAAVVKPGTILYELDGVSEEVAKRAFNRVAHKLPVKVRLVRRRHN